MRYDYAATYPEDREQNARSDAQMRAQAWDLLTRIHPGDLAVLPLYDPWVAWVGVVTSGCEYRPNLSEQLRHTRRVIWLGREIPRQEFSEEIQRSLGRNRTVYPIQQEGAAATIFNAVDRRL